MSFAAQVLGAAQQSVLRRLAGTSTLSRFYLGGGTAVALHLGHRRSLDLDWFTAEPMGDPLSLAQELRAGGVDFHTDALDRGTLHGRIGRVPVSFFEYRYPLLQAPVRWEQSGSAVASLDDLACMKLSAVAQRGSKKDFLDIYALGLRHTPLDHMLELYWRKFSIEDVSSVLYGLVYFDDADRERTPWMLWEVDWRTVKTTLRRWAKDAAG